MGNLRTVMQRDNKAPREIAGLNVSKKLFLFSAFVVLTRIAKPIQLGHSQQQTSSRKTKMTINKNDIVTLKGGKQFKVTRITSTHIDLQKAEHAHLLPVVSGFTSWPVRGANSIWHVIQK